MKGRTKWVVIYVANTFAIGVVGFILGRESIKLKVRRHIRKHGFPPGKYEVNMEDWN